MPPEHKVFNTTNIILVVAILLVLGINMLVSCGYFAHSQQAPIIYDDSMMNHSASSSHS